MAPVNLKYIVSFTSQDDNHKANNLIKGDGTKKWLSHPKDKSGRAEVVIQLEAPTLLQYLDIGVIWCAFLEVRVGRSDWPQSREFATLVPTVSLMSPTDCLLRRGTSSSCMFSKNDFSQDLASQPWDRVQLVCRQPFRKDSQFGISFIHIKSQCSLPSPVVEKHGAAKECGDQEPVKSSKNVELIKSHFFRNHNTSDSPSKADQLKSRLLRMTGSTEQEGVGPFQALSRTAQIVMKASEKADSLSPYRKQISPHRQGRLLSEHVSTKKNDVAIDEEIKTFLPTLRITVAEIDQVTVADLRHKFEKSKRRKLTCKEKKLFFQLFQEFFSDLLEGDRENGQQVPGRAGSLKAVPSESKPRSARKDQNSSQSDDRANMSLPNTPEVQNKERSFESSKVTIFSSSPVSPRSKSPEVHHHRQSAAPKRVLHSQTLQTSEPVVTSSNCLSSRPKNIVRPCSVIDLTQDVESNEVSTTVRNQRGDIHGANGSSSSLKRKSGHSHRDGVIKTNNSGKTPNSFFSGSSFEDVPTLRSEPSSCPRRKIQTLESINKSFEGLRDTFMASQSEKSPSHRLPARGMKRKLNQRSLNLLEMFRQEIEESEDENTDIPTSSAPSPQSPWLSAAKKKVTAGESEALPSTSRQYYHSELERKKNSCSLSTSSRSSNKITTKSKSSPSLSEGKMCHTCLSIISHSGYAAHQRICASLEIPSTSTSLPSHSEPTSCGESGFSFPSEQIPDELLIDDEDFGECPICMQSFPLDSLPVHASECGL